MNRSEQLVSRKTALRSAAGVAGAAGLLALAAPKPAAASSTAPAAATVRRSVLLVDGAQRQRLLATTAKPPAVVNGRSYPRGGPEDATYVIFNEQNGDERGGFTIDRNGISLGLDYSNAEAIKLGTIYEGTAGITRLAMAGMPDPSLDPERITAADSPLRVMLMTGDRSQGVSLSLFDSNSAPRIKLEVDADDVATIRVLDADGGVVAQLPPAA